MDPNTTLANLRIALAVWSESRDADTINDAANNAAEAAQALDEWLSRGGFLPTPWQGRRQATPDELGAIIDATLGADAESAARQGRTWLGDADAEGASEATQAERSE